MTKTEKPITRESSAVYMGRQICCSIEGAAITLWPKGTSKRYRINLATVYVHAKQAGGRPVKHPAAEEGLDN